MQELLKKWEDIKESIRIEHGLPDISYNTWITPLTVDSIENNTVYIKIPKELGQSLSYYNSRFLLAFKVAVNEALNRNVGEQLNIEFISELDSKNKSSINIDTNPEQKEKYKNTNLNQKYTFDTFVVGSNNRLAQAGALAVAERPGEVYNPLFIYGGVGLGKTHLMHAIGNFIISQNPDKNVLYVTSEQFTNEIVEAIRIGKNSPEAIINFRNKYRNIDVLMIDDIQFIIGKNQTQEEFFHTFNQLYEQKKQIIITSDKPPKDMDILDERYRSRFSWGLTADIQFPDFETRMAILKKKMEAETYYIDNEVLEYIANNVKSNIRELEGSLNKVIALSTLEHKNIDIELTKEALKDIVSPNSPAKITPQNIMDIVCDHFYVSEEDIKSSKRNKEIAYPRQIIMYLCRSMTNYTYIQIAKFLGNRDHSTVIYGERAISDLIEKDEATRNNIEKIINKIKSN